jgi:ABC-2 type transport system permease protein
MNIFLREFRANLKSLVIWSGIVILFVYVGFSKFSAYYGNPEMLAVLDALPPAMLAAFGVDGTFLLTELTGFYGIMITYFGLILGIAAAMWGSDIISKEEREKTVEFSLTLPVTRARVVIAKTAAALVNCLVLLLVTWGITLVSAQNYSPDSEFYTFLKVSILAFFLIQLIFLALGIFLGCAMKRHKRAGSLAVSILLGTYFASVLAGMSKDMEFLKYFSPFKYFDPARMLRDSGLELSYILLSVAIIVILGVGAFFTYQKRDLYI